MAGPTPAQIAKPGSEHAHQVAIFCWAAMQFSRLPDLADLYANPNGGKRDKSVAMNLQREGVKAGIPDMTLPVARGPYHGLYIELKKPGLENRKNGGCSDAQVKWIKKLRNQGFYVDVCYGWEDTASLLESYLNNSFPVYKFNSIPQD